MKKRISKSEHKRQVQKKTIKKRRESMNSAAGDDDSIGLRPLPKILAFDFLLLGLLLLIFLPFCNKIPESLAMIQEKNEAEIIIATTTPVKAVAAESKTVESPTMKKVKIEDEKNLSVKKTLTPPVNAKKQAPIKKEEKKTKDKPVDEVIKIATIGKTDKESTSTTESLATNKEKLRKDVLAIIKNTPMEKMTDAIVLQDRQIAAFLVGIALKESHFGKHSPKNSNGDDCYNYWGYRGKENTTRSGYSCFDSPEHAIQVVGKRIQHFTEQGRDNPAKMVVWKCGYSCAAFTPESVQGWINDVGINYYKINPKNGIAKN